MRVDLAGKCQKREADERQSGECVEPTAGPRQASAVPADPCVCTVPRKGHSCGNGYQNRAHPEEHGECKGDPGLGTPRDTASTMTNSVKGQGTRPATKPVR
jgi:hypothetical protein